MRRQVVGLLERDHRGQRHGTEVSGRGRDPEPALQPGDRGAVHALDENGMPCCGGGDVGAGRRATRDRDTDSGQAIGDQSRRGGSQCVGGDDLPLCDRACGAREDIGSSRHRHDRGQADSEDRGARYDGATGCEGVAHECALRTRRTRHGTASGVVCGVSCRVRPSELAGRCGQRLNPKDAAGCRARKWVPRSCPKRMSLVDT